jgi:hypothetical protein
VVFSLAEAADVPLLAQLRRPRLEACITVLISIVDPDGK